MCWSLPKLNREGFCTQAEHAIPLAAMVEFIKEEMRSTFLGNPAVFSASVFSTCGEPLAKGPFGLTDVESLQCGRMRVIWGAEAAEVAAEEPITGAAKVRKAGSLATREERANTVAPKPDSAPAAAALALMYSTGQCWDVYYLRMTHCAGN